ncbi:hypothetical protein BCR39DRAFT_534328 [Naematelia encephala]|uniref:Uncharacterized protein n=1 Tax=Naematelia encephala TaxID=71784 RepID=A0A1Y2B1I8_9TREE|nr:hypothetical protein BCR39DRAFT_534328 [Naematelia encephala]
MDLCYRLGVSFSAMDATLSITMHVLDRIERAFKASTTTSNPTAPYWQRDRSDYFPQPGPAWKAMIEAAYHIYELQSTVSLYTGRELNSTAIALAVCAIEAVVEKEIPSFTDFTSTVCKEYGQSPYSVRERCRELHNLCVAWSTSLTDAGITVPQLLPPKRGNLGTGVAYYGTQRNRAIPLGSMYAASVLTIAKNWQVLAKTRLRTRVSALPLEDELHYAQRMFALGGMKGTPRRWPPAEGTGPRSLNSFPQIMEAPPEEPTIEDLLAMEDNSSDDESVASSSGDLDGNARPKPGMPGTSLALPSRGLDSAPASVEDYLSAGTPMSRAMSSFSTSEYASASDTESDTSTNRYRRLLDGGKRRRRKDRAASAALTARSSSISTDASAESSASAYQRYMREVSRIDDASIPHAGILVREREEYLGYKIDLYRQRGLLVSKDVEMAMLRWFAEQLRRGSIPRVLNEDYFTALGISGDVRQINLEPYIDENRWRWSPTESLLRAGVKPTEFPIQYIPSSLTALAQDLEHYRTDELAPEGSDPIDDVQLDRELDILFPPGTQTFESLLNTEEEKVKRAEQLAEYDEFLRELHERQKPIADDDDDRWDPLKALAAEELEEIDAESEAARLKEATLMAMLRRGGRGSADDDPDEEEGWDRMFELDAEPTGSRKRRRNAQDDGGDVGRKEKEKGKRRKSTLPVVESKRSRKGKNAAGSKGFQHFEHPISATADEATLEAASSFGVPPTLALLNDDDDGDDKLDI